MCLGQRSALCLPDSGRKAYAAARRPRGSLSMVSEFRDVVLQDVVLDYSRFDLILYLDLT